MSMRVTLWTAQPPMSWSKAEASRNIWYIVVTPEVFHAAALNRLQRFKEAKSLLRKTVPVAHRVLGADNRLTLTLRSNYATALYKADGATLDDLREAVTTLEEATRTARRVMGGAHPLSSAIEGDLRCARTVLRARETPSPGAA